MSTVHEVLEPNSPNMLYLTWGEVIVFDGLFNNQVLEQLKQIRQLASTMPIHLLSGMPLGNRYWVKNRAAFYAELAKIRAQLAALQISFEHRWIPAIARWFHSQPYQLPFYTVGQMSYLAKLVEQRQINLVHCRSYHATRLALLTRLRHQLSYKVIFDARGMFPEEAVLAHYFMEESPAYRRWKAIEHMLLDQADAVVAVSATFADYLRGLTRNPQIHTIATSTNLELFRPNAELRRNQRQLLQFTAADKVLIYVGSLGTKHGWHNLANLIAVDRVFRSEFSPTKLLIVTRSPHAPLRAALQQAGYQPDDYRLVTANSPAETSAYIQAGDYAALSYYDVESRLEQQVGQTVIASKSGEYLGVGLPMIVNRTAGAAAQLVSQTGVGCVYQSGDEASIREPLRQIDAHYAEIQRKAIAVAHEHFSAAGNAAKYIALYQQLLNTPVKSTP